MNEVLNLYLETDFSVNDIAEKLDMPVKEIVDILKANRYVGVTKRTKERTITLKNAIDEYLFNNKQIGATTIAKKYGIPHTCLIDALHSIGEDVPNKQNETKFNEHIFDCIDTEEKAYWLGFIFADGYIDSSPLYENKKSRYVFELGLSNKDETHLIKFNTFAEYNGNNIKRKKVKLEGKIFDCCRWSIVNKHLWNNLKDIGCLPNKSLILEFPYKIFKDPSLIRHFIRGYFDGDGSLGIYENRISCSCLGTKSMLDAIMQYSGFENIHYKHDKRHSENTYSFEFCSQKAITFLNYIYKDCNIYLDRKYNKYLEICRLWEESHKLLEGNIGEGCDANTEIT